MIEEKKSNLIIGYLQNRLNKEGTKVFFAWLDENAENKKVFFELKAIYESVNTPVDIEKSWNRLLSKHENRSKKSARIEFWKYAAVAMVAVLITSSAFFSLHTGKQNHYPVKYTTGNGLVANTLELPDGSRVQLAHSSELYYGNEYGKNKREVYLKGEAFFDIATNKDKPFVVKLDKQEITALGTQFNVMAYPSDSVYTTTLIEGSVKLNTGNTENILHPNQQLKYNNVKNSIRIANNVNTEFVTSWISGYYHFSEETLKTMLHRLGHIYGVKINTNFKTLDTRKFSGTFYSGQKISDILEIIKISIPIKYSIEDDQILIIEK